MCVRGEREVVELAYVNDPGDVHMEIKIGYGFGVWYRYR